MKKEKYYAVIIGVTPGIYRIWEEAKAQTNGFPGSLVKSFDSEEEAIQFLQNSKVDEDVKNQLNIDELVEKDLSECNVVAFVDGSFDNSEKIAGFGCVIIEPNERKIFEIADVVKTTRFVDSRNIAPEIFAVLESLKWALSKQYKKITIYHDLEATGKWARGEFKAASDIAKLFLKELNEKFYPLLDIKFVWVKGHSCNNYNDQADSLAKEVVRSKKPTGRYGENFFKGTGVSFKIFESIAKELSDINSISLTEKNSDTDKKVYIFKFENEKLTVTYYHSNGTTLLQGEVKRLFSEYLSRYTLHIPNFEMIRAYSDSFRYTIDFHRIDQEIKNFNLPGNYPPSGITLLKQSLVLLNLDRQEYDYSHYTSPAYRALEGHLNYLFSETGNHISKNEYGGHFDKDSSGAYNLKTKSAKSHAYCSKIEQIYNLIYIKRHPIMHFGEVFNVGYDTTLLVPDIKEAKSRISEVLNLIKF